MSFLELRNKELLWQKKYDTTAPKAGDPAPDFKLVSTDGESPFSLLQFKGKRPVVLIFGSFT